MTPPDKAPKALAEEREVKLAEALRANLRRRKAGANQKPGGGDKGKAAGGG